MNTPTKTRFTLDEYHRLTDLGFFGEDDPIELIRGEIIQMAAKGTAHTVCCHKLIRELSDYLSGHPTPEDILLVIEIADSSLNYDREIKLPLYAAAVIDNYWLFNLIDHQLETYSTSYQKNQGTFSYIAILVEL